MEYGVLFFLVIVAFCYFQTILSDKDNAFLGLILPAISFIASIVLLILWIDSFSIPKIIFTLLFVNIPTYILLLIYRAKQKNHKN